MSEGLRGPVRPRSQPLTVVGLRDGAAVVPEQFNPDPGRSGSFHLWAAVLADAVALVRTPVPPKTIIAPATHPETVQEQKRRRERERQADETHHRHVRARAEARAWFAATERGPGTFFWVTSHLGLSAVGILDGLDSRRGSTYRVRDSSGVRPVQMPRTRTKPHPTRCT